MSAIYHPISTRTTDITYLGVPLTCDFEYSPGEPRTWDDPGCPSEVILTCAKAGGVDVTALLSNDDRKEVERIIAEQVDEE